MKSSGRLLVLVFLAVGLAGAQVPASLFSGMRWRHPGPMRGGRVSAVAGVPGQPGVYYIGTPGGGIFKTVDGGVVWKPVFDSVQAVSSIGSLAVASSDPNVIYAGTGDVVVVGGSVNVGDGMYKSTDAGKTWTHIGLDQSRHIVALLVDPHNPAIVLAAVLGATYKKSPQRGVYRSTDGGAHWTRVLYTDDITGAVDIAAANDDPRVVYAVMMHHYEPPAGAPSIGGASLGVNNLGDTAIYKSSDEGATWKRLSAAPLPQPQRSRAGAGAGGGRGGFARAASGPPRFAANGLPADDMGRTGIAVADHTRGQRIYLICLGREAGLYRSDDGGAHWRKMHGDPRLTSTGYSDYFQTLYADPKDPDEVYVMQTSMYRSLNGGESFISLKGAPGGDDNHLLWIDPANHNRLLMGADQGAAISLDEGQSWTTWYNQPTVQVYRISTDQRYPYWIYASQQDTGAIAVRSRGDMGEVTSLDWYPIAGPEFGDIVPSPLDASPTKPPVVFAGGRGIVRIDQVTHQFESVAPSVGRGAPGSTQYRFSTNPTIVFSPEDPHRMYLASQYVLATDDGGMHWQRLSPDLTIASGKRPGRGSLDALAPSPLTAQVIWTGSTNGRVHVTRDGGQTWTDVTPAAAPAGGDYFSIAASHFDAGTAFASEDNHNQSGDFTPYIYRTRDYGQHWTLITAGLPQHTLGSFVRVVCADPVRQGLLFAGTEESVYVSFDAGDHWQSLRLNLPTTSYRDLAIHGDDLIAGTYGRGFWILDDLAPLRQATAAMAADPAYFYQPSTVTRVRRDVNGDTPMPPEVPHGQNPPDGAILDYYLSSVPQGAVRLQVFNAQDALVRTLSSNPLSPLADVVKDPPPIPAFWLKPRHPLSKHLGDNRVVWNLRYDPPPSRTHNYAQVMGAVPDDTPPSPQGPLVLPGRYKVVLTVDGKQFSRELTVRNDPRVGQSPETMAALQQQMKLVLGAYHGVQDAYAGSEAAAALAADLKKVEAHAPEAVKTAAAALRKSATEIAGAGGGRFGNEPEEESDLPEFQQQRQRTQRPPSFGGVDGELMGLVQGAQTADMAPTAAQQEAYQQACAQLNTVMANWQKLRSGALAKLNAMLSANHLQAITSGPLPPDPSCN